MTNEEMERAIDFLLKSQANLDRKSTRLNSSHVEISYAVFCLKKKIAFVFKLVHPAQVERLHLPLKSSAWNLGSPSSMTTHAYLLYFPPAPVKIRLPHWIAVS